jgi:hypothetical protein
MKKFLTAILAIIYLVVSSGFTLNTHYCMGKIASVDLFQHDKCGKCGMKQSTGGCCKDEVKVVKLQDSHKLISNEINIYSPVAVIDNSKSIFDTKLFSKEIKAGYNNHSPPISPGISLNILYGVFRI